MCAAFLDRPNEPLLQTAVVQECITHTLFSTLFLTYDHKRRYQSRRCGDDSHPGEEIYTPSGDVNYGLLGEER